METPAANVQSDLTCSAASDIMLPARSIVAGGADAVH